MLTFAEENMKKITEQYLANAYLVHREKDYSPAFVIRGAIRLYILQIAIFLIALWGAFALPPSSPYKALCIWGTGITMGAFIRDAGWLRRMKALWPLTQKLIDWPKVETIAKQEQ